MNDKDKEAFEKWYQDYFSISSITILNIPHHFTKAWQAACEYKEKELDQLKLAEEFVETQKKIFLEEFKKLKDLNE